jgi:hypothetical protein
MRFLAGILELVVLGIPVTVIYGLPLLLTGLIWSGGAILGGVLGEAFAGKAGLLPGSVLAAGAMAGIYSGVICRYVGWLGLGAGWRYWRENHASDVAFEEPFGTPRSDPQTSPRPLDILLDTAAACTLAATVAMAGGLVQGSVAGALIFAGWGGIWGLYLGTMEPRPGRRPIDLQAVCPANFCCPWETPWHRFSVRWAVGCGIGYALQALLLGILPGLIGGYVLTLIGG